MQSPDPTLAIGDRAVDLMRRYSASASPRAYELWYTYVTGIKPHLNDALRAVLAETGQVSTAGIDALFTAHLAPERLLKAAERTGDSVLAEIDQVTGLITAALGSTERYDRSLRSLTHDLTGPVDRMLLLDVLESLVAATRDVAATNRDLDERLRESRSDIVALRQDLDVVRQESMIDPLTGIANRRAFDTTLIAAVDEARDSGAQLALVIIDIDHFKRFNDSYGHLTGDQVLRLVAAAMRENVGCPSTLARFGGEEFAMILPEAEMADAFACAERIRRNVMVRELLKRSTGESLGRVTISLGIAALRDDDSAASLLERADACMYRAKRAGRNRTATDAEQGDPVSNAA